MEIEKDCFDYLQGINIVQIVKQQNALSYQKVFDCLNKHKKYFYNIIPLTHKAIPNDILLMCAEDAFMTTQATFYQNVKNDQFEPGKDDCISYVSVIFKRSYLKLYSKEAKIKMLSADYRADFEFDKNHNEGEKKLEQKDFIALKVQSVLDELSDEDKRIYQLYYRENMKVKEIAKLLSLQPHAVSGRLYNFHVRFGKAWADKNKKHS